MFTLEIIPWKINEIFQLSSINSDLNSILHQKGLIFKNIFILENINWNVYLKQFIESNKETWINFIKWFYDKLFNWDISYSRNSQQWKMDYNNYKKLNISLEKPFYFQLKKPWVEELSSWNYTYSSRVIKEIIEEFKDYLEENEKVIFEFEYWYTNYSKIMKNIFYWLKMFFQNQTENEELFSSFTDKLEFVKFNFSIYNNSKNHEKLKEVVRKNLWVYGNKFNRYVINKTSFFRNLYQKIQIDTLVSQSLNIPIQNNISKNNKTRIIPFARNIIENNMIKTKEKNDWVIIWKINKDNIKENKKLLCVNKNDLKNSHGLLVWGTGSWKSHSSVTMNCGEIFKSVENKKTNDYWSKFILVDPNSSLLLNINKVLKEYKKPNLNNLEIVNYSKTKNENITNSKTLVFNPLLIKDLYNYTDNNDKFIDILNLHTETILESIKWTFDNSSFWANNQDILIIMLEFLILLNNEKYSKYKDFSKIDNSNFNKNQIEEYEESLILFSIWDIVDILSWMLLNNKLLSPFDDLISNIITKWWFVWKKWEYILEKIEYFLTLSKKDVALFNSTINKLKIYKDSLRKTFGSWNIWNITLDLKDLFLKNENITHFIWFDLWDFSQKEKEIVTSFIINYSYYFWTKRDQFNKNLWNINLIIDEFWSLVWWENIISSLGKSMAQTRKFKLSYSLYYQDLTSQKWVREIYENIWYIIVFSISDKQAEFLINDLNSWSNVILEKKDLINQNRWEFKILLKTKNENITLSWEALDFNNPNELKIILNQ